MKISSSFSLFRASCRIRTNDPEITNHVLWPTELKRRGWVSLLYRAATTNYLCCDQALEDSKGAGRMGLTRISTCSRQTSYRCFSIAGAKVGIFLILANSLRYFFQKKYSFMPLLYFPRSFLLDSRKKFILKHPESVTPCIGYETGES